MTKKIYISIIGIAAIAFTAATSIGAAQTPQAKIEDPTLVNEYVRVSRFTAPPASTLLIPANGRAHLLVRVSRLLVNEPQLTDVTDADHPMVLDGNVQLFDAGEIYRIANHDKVQVAGLLIELAKDPGYVANHCYWSIAMDNPVPIILADHLTVFGIRVGGTTRHITEPKSSIVPQGEILIAKSRHAPPDAVWLESPEEIFAIPRPPTPAQIISGSPFPVYPIVWEITFYDKTPFCCAHEGLFANNHVKETSHVHSNCMKF